MGTLIVNYDQDLDVLIRGGKYDFVSPEITKGNFPLPEQFHGLGKKTMSFELFEFEDIESQDAIGKITLAKFRPAILIESLTLGVQLNVPKDKPIVALGQTCRITEGGFYYVPVIGIDKGKWSLSWCWFKDAWAGHSCYFLGIKI